MEPCIGRPADSMQSSPSQLTKRSRDAYPGLARSPCRDGDADVRSPPVERQKTSDVPGCDFCSAEDDCSPACEATSDLSYNARGAAHFFGLLSLSERTVVLQVVGAAGCMTTGGKMLIEGAPGSEEQLSRRATAAGAVPKYGGVEDSPLHSGAAAAAAAPVLSSMFGVIPDLADVEQQQAADAAEAVAVAGATAFCKPLLPSVSRAAEPAEQDVRGGDGSLAGLDALPDACALQDDDVGACEDNEDEDEVCPHCKPPSHHNESHPKHRFAFAFKALKRHLQIQDASNILQSTHSLPLASRL